MADIETITNAKIELEIRTALDNLSGSINALVRTMNAQHKLHSGEFYGNVNALCIQCFPTIKKLICDNQSKVVEQSILARDDLIARLEINANKYLQLVFDKTHQEIQGAANMVGNPRLYDMTKNDLSEAREQALAEISLFLETLALGKASENKKKAINGVFSGILGGIKKWLGI